MTPINRRKSVNLFWSIVQLLNITTPPHRITEDISKLAK